MIKNAPERLINVPEGQKHHRGVKNVPEGSKTFQMCQKHHRDEKTPQSGQKHGYMYTHIFLSTHIFRWRQL